MGVYQFFFRGPPYKPLRLLGLIRGDKVRTISKNKSAKLHHTIGVILVYKNTKFSPHHHHLLLALEQKLDT